MYYPSYIIVTVTTLCLVIILLTTDKQNIISIYNHHLEVQKRSSAFFLCSKRKVKPKYLPTIIIIKTFAELDYHLLFLLSFQEIVIFLL